jgi:hypothetical protein
VTQTECLLLNACGGATNLTGPRECMCFGNPCQREGRCTLTDLGCAATERDCKESDICKRQGRCSLVGNRCKAVTGLECSQLYYKVLSYETSREPGECDDYVRFEALERSRR